MASLQGYLMSYKTRPFQVVGQGYSGSARSTSRARAAVRRVIERDEDNAWSCLNESDVFWDLDHRSLIYGIF
jgi:hypothetical protein